MPEIAPKRVRRFCFLQIKTLRIFHSDNFQVFDFRGSKFQDFQTALPPAEVFESARTHFRMRASFAMWREGRDPTTLHYVMYERGDSKTPHEVTSFPMGSRRINELMTPLRDGLAAELVLHERIGDARFLTTTLVGNNVALVLYSALMALYLDPLLRSLRYVHLIEPDRSFIVISLISPASAH